VSQNLSALVAALETINQKDLELSVVETEQIFKKGVVTHVLQQNALVASIRQVAIKDVLKFTDRYIASKLDNEDPRDVFFNAAREVTSFVEYAVNGPALERVMAVEHRDLLPAAHPFSTKTISPITASALRVRNAAWVAWDPRITDDAARKAVFDAYVQQPNTTKGLYAVARLESLTASVVPADIKLGAVTAAFGVGNPFAGNNSSAARSARAKLQRRDRKGRFAEMGGGSRILAMIGNMIKSFTGKFAGIPQDSNNIEVEIAGNSDLPGGIYSVPASKVEGLKAILRGNMVSPAVPANSRNSRAAIDLQDLLASRKSAPTGWTDNGDGKFTSADGYSVSQIDIPQDATGMNDKNGNFLPFELQGKFIGAGPNGSYDRSKPVFELKDANGNVVGRAQEWANLQKLAADSDESKGAAPKTKARLRTPQPAGFRQEPGDNTEPIDVVGDSEVEPLPAPPRKEDDNFEANYINYLATKDYKAKDVTDTDGKYFLSEQELADGGKLWQVGDDMDDNGPQYVAQKADGTFEVNGKTFYPKNYGGDVISAADDAFSTADKNRSAGKRGFAQEAGSEEKVNSETLDGWAKKYGAVETTTPDDTAKNMRRWALDGHDIVMENANTDSIKPYNFKIKITEGPDAGKFYWGSSVADIPSNYQYGLSREEDLEQLFSFPKNIKRKKDGLEPLKTDKNQQRDSKIERIKNNRAQRAKVTNAIATADPKKIQEALDDAAIPEKYQDVLKAQLKKAQDFENGLSEDPHWTKDEIAAIEQMAKDYGYEGDIVPNEEGVYSFTLGSEDDYSWAELTIFPGNRADLTQYTTGAYSPGGWDEPPSQDVDSETRSIPVGSSMDDLENIFAGGDNSSDAPEPPERDEDEGFYQKPGEEPEIKTVDDYVNSKYGRGFKETTTEADKAAGRRVWFYEDTDTGGGGEVTQNADGTVDISGTTFSQGMFGERQSEFDDSFDPNFYGEGEDGRVGAIDDAFGTIKYKTGDPGVPDSDGFEQAPGLPGFRQKSGKGKFELPEDFDSVKNWKDLGNGKYEYTSKDGRLKVRYNEEFDAEPDGEGGMRGYENSYAEIELDGEVIEDSLDANGASFLFGEGEREFEPAELADRVVKSLKDAQSKGFKQEAGKDSEAQAESYLNELEQDASEILDRNPMGTTEWTSKDGRVKAVHGDDGSAGEYVEVFLDGKSIGGVGKYSPVEDPKTGNYSEPWDSPDKEPGWVADGIYELLKENLATEGFKQEAGKEKFELSKEFYNDKNWSKEPFKNPEWTSADGKVKVKYVSDGDVNDEGRPVDTSYLEVSVDGEVIGDISAPNALQYNAGDPNDPEYMRTGIPSSKLELDEYGDDVQAMVDNHLKSKGGFKQSAGEAGGVRKSHISDLDNWSSDPSDGGEGTYTSPDGRLTLEAMADADTDGEGGMKDLSRIAVSYDGEEIGTLPKLGVMYNEADLADDVDNLVSKYLEKQTGGFNQQPGSGRRKVGNFRVIPREEFTDIVGAADTSDGGIVRLEKTKNGTITPTAYNRFGQVMAQSEPTTDLDAALKEGERLLSGLEGKAQDSPEVSGFSQKPGEEPPAWTKDPATPLQYNKLQGILDNQADRLPTDVRDMVEEAVANKALTKGEMGKLLAEVGKSADLSISYTPKVDKAHASDRANWKYDKKSKSYSYTSADGRLSINAVSPEDGATTVTYDGKPVQISRPYGSEIWQSVDNGGVPIGDSVDTAIKDRLDFENKTGIYSDKSGFAQAPGSTSKAIRTPQPQVDEGRAASAKFAKDGFLEQTTNYGSGDSDLSWEIDVDDMESAAIVVKYSPNRGTWYAYAQYRDKRGNLSTAENGDLGDFKTAEEAMAAASAFNNDEDRMDEYNEIIRDARKARMQAVATKFEEAVANKDYDALKELLNDEDVLTSEDSDFLENDILEEMNSISLEEERQSDVEDALASNDKDRLEELLGDDDYEEYHSRLEDAINDFKHGEEDPDGFEQAPGKKLTPRNNQTLKPNSIGGYDTGTDGDGYIEVNPNKDGTWEVSHAYNYLIDENGPEGVMDEGSQTFKTKEEAMAYANDKLEYYNSQEVYDDASDHAMEAAYRGGMYDEGFEQRPGRQVNIGDFEVFKGNYSLSDKFEDFNVRIEKTPEGKWKVTPSVFGFPGNDVNRREDWFDQTPQTFDNLEDAKKSAVKEANYLSNDTNRSGALDERGPGYGFAQKPGKKVSPEVSAKNKELAKRLMEKGAFDPDGGLDEDDPDYEALQDIKDRNEAYLDNLAATDPAEYFYTIAKAGEFMGAEPSDFRRMIEKPYNYHAEVLESEMNSWVGDNNSGYWLDEIGHGSEGEGFAQKAGTKKVNPKAAIQKIIDAAPKDQGFAQRAGKEDGLKSNGTIAGDIYDPETYGMMDWASKWTDFSVSEGENRLGEWWKWQEEFGQWAVSEDPKEAAGQGLVDVYTLRDILDGNVGTFNPLSKRDSGWRDRGDGSHEFKSETINIFPTKNDDGTFDYTITNAATDELIDTIENVGAADSVENLISGEFRSDLEDIGYEVSGRSSNAVNLFSDPYDRSRGFAQKSGSDSGLLEENPAAIKLSGKFSDTGSGGINYQDSEGRSKGSVQMFFTKDKNGKESYGWMVEYLPSNGEGIVRKSFMQKYDGAYEGKPWIAAEKHLRNLIAKDNASQNKQKTGGFSAKQMEPATPAQYALLQEYADERVPADDLTAQAIQDALANRNLTKAQMSALIGPMNDAEFKPGVDPNKPSDRALKSLNSKLVTKDLTPEEVKDILDNLPNMNRAEVDALNDRLRRKKDRPETIGFAQEPGGSDDENMEQLMGDDLGNDRNVETQGEMSDYYNSLKGDRIAELQKKLDAANEEINIFGLDDLQEMLDEADPDSEANLKRYGKTWPAEQSYIAAQDLRDAAEQIRNSNNPNVDKSLADDLDNAANQVMKRMEDRINPLLFASVEDPYGTNFDLGDVDTDLDQMRELYFETDTDEIKKYLDQTGVYGDVRSGGAEAVVSDKPEEDGENKGKYRASVSYGGGTAADDQVEYFDDPEDAKDWAANEVSNLSSYHQVGLTHPDKSFSDLDAERDAAIANGTEQEFLSRLSDVAKIMRDQRGDEKLSRELDDYVERAQAALDKKKGNAGGQGFAQRPGSDENEQDIIDDIKSRGQDIIDGLRDNGKIDVETDEEFEARIADYQRNLDGLLFQLNFGNSDTLERFGMDFDSTAWTSSGNDELLAQLEDLVPEARRRRSSAIYGSRGFAQEPGSGTPVRNDKLNPTSDGGFGTNPYSDSQIEVNPTKDGKWEVNHAYNYMIDENGPTGTIDEGSKLFDSKEEALAFANEKLDYYNSSDVDRDAEDHNADRYTGFDQKPGNAVVSPKMGEPASDAQYDYLKELGDTQDGISPDLATAIQDALSSKNLTKAQVGALLGQLRALKPKAGIDTSKPTPRQIQRVKDLANSLGLSPAEKRKLGLSKVSSMSSDEVQKLIDNLKRRGGGDEGSGGVRPKGRPGDKPGGGGSVGQVPGKLISYTPRSKFLEKDRSDAKEIYDRVNKNLDKYASQDSEFAKKLEESKKKYPEGIYSMIDIAADPNSTQQQIDDVIKDVNDLNKALQSSKADVFAGDTNVLDGLAKYKFAELTPEVNKQKLSGGSKKHSEGDTVDSRFSAMYNPNLVEYKSSENGRGSTNTAIGYVTTDALEGMAGNEIRNASVVNDIAKDLKNGVGFKEPIIMIYDPKTGKAFITEGNHRLAAAKKAGVKYVPVRIVNLDVAPGDQIKMERVGKPLGRRAAPIGGGEWSSTIQPSQIFDDSQLLQEDAGGFAQAAGSPRAKRFNEMAADRKFVDATTEKDAKKDISRWSREENGLKTEITERNGRFTAKFSDKPKEEVDLGINESAAFKEAERQIMLRTAEFDTVDLDGFAQKEGDKGPKRQRVLEAIASVSNALGLFDEWKGKTTKVREDVNNVGEFVNNMRYVKADLEKAINNLKNSKGVEEKMAAISELTAAIKKAKLAARIAKDRWKRNHPEDLKPKAPKTPKAIEAPTVEKVSKKFEDDLTAAEEAISPTPGRLPNPEPYNIPRGGVYMYDENGNRLRQDGTPFRPIGPSDLDGFAQSLPTETVSPKDFKARQAKAIADNKAAAASMMDIFRKRIKNPAWHKWQAPYSDYPADDPMTAPVNPSNMPFNPSSNHQYSAINHHALATAAAERGYTDPRWMTSAQAKKLGATVRDGEQGVKIMTFMTIEDEESGERSIVQVPRFVFNAQQMDGLEPYSPSQQPKMDAAQAIDFVLGRFSEAEKKRGKSGNIKIWEDLYGSDTPMWSPAGARRPENIRMPDRSKYDSPEDYLYSLFHELAHATGTQDRQGREAHLAQARGDMTMGQLAVEEATAEIASQLLLQRLGLNYNPDRTAEYLRSHDLNDAQLNEAMAKAELAVDYVLGNDVLPPWHNSSSDMMEAAEVPGYTPPASRSWNPNTNLGPQDAPSAFPAGTPGSDENPEVTGFAQKPGKFDRTGKKSVTDSKTATEKVMAGLLEKIKQGETPWRKPYKEGEKYAGIALPRNPSSKHIYSGVNAMALRFAQEENGYSDPRWMTYNQASAMGGQVRKGEKGTFILVPMRITQQDEKDPNKKRSFTMFKATAVFNAEQIDGLNLPELSTESLPKMTPLDAQEFIVERYKKAMAARTGKAPNIKHTYVGSGGAHQAPNWGTLSDEVTLPNLEQFNSPEDLFDTIAHELVHSTGHPDRLDRSDLTKDYANDLESRAREELIAEIGGALLANMFGVDATFDNSAAYVQSWLKHLQSNPDEIINATSQAQKAVDYILGTDLGDWSPIDGYSIGNAVQKPTEEEES